MYTLRNSLITVSILDPIKDRDRFGTRYCTGGYIFQISDAVHGDLLSGPTFPDDFNTFDGQGIPDAFNRSPLLSTDVPNALIPGIGICDLESDTVLDFCEWNVSEEDFRIRMTTRHAFGQFDFELERRVSVTGRTVRSATRIRNTGASVPIRWFPHPFFPHPESVELCRFSIPVFIPENDGYGFARNGFICRRSGEWPGDHYLALDIEGGSALTVLQRHPKVGLVAGVCSYSPTFLPIWGNANTFSWEPYLEATIASGQEKRWHIDYIF